MPHVSHTALAKGDLLAIWHWIAEQEHSPLNAERFLWKLNTQGETLADIPFMGVARSDVAPDIRSFPVNPYTIYYRRVPDGVEIVRIIHQARDLTHIPFPTP